MRPAADGVEHRRLHGGAIGIGFLAAALFLRSQLGYALHPPGGAYYLVVAAGLLAALGVLASTLPLLRRITDPGTARFE